MESNNFKFKLQTFIAATFVAIIISGCATKTDFSANANKDVKTKTFRMHNFTFDNEYR